MRSDVIAEIDAAMDDWEHHGDAMVYLAPWDEPVVRDPRGPVEAAMATGMDGYAAYAYYGRWHPVLGKALDVMSPGMDGRAEAYRPRWVSNLSGTNPRLTHHDHVHVDFRRDWARAARATEPEGTQVNRSEMVRPHAPLR